MEKDVFTKFVESISHITPENCCIEEDGMSEATAERHRKFSMMTDEEQLQMVIDGKI